MKRNFLLILIAFGMACVSVQEKKAEVSPPKEDVTPLTKTSLVVLGTAQDAGSPQIGCTKKCCQSLWEMDNRRKMVSSLGIVDVSAEMTWIFDATPDFKDQTKKISDYAGNESIKMPDGVFLTHGHMGHYTGLMHLGREAIGADRVKVFAMSQMQNYLTNNGPWSQLVALKNIVLTPLIADSGIQISPNIKVTPFLVPHRGEYTETVGYKIEGKKTKVLFIPDIDKWNKWERNIVEEIKAVDVAFIDATFYKNGEVGNRDMSEIPHPFVEESMKLFDTLPKREKGKIYFIHMNHTNPLLIENSEAQKEVLKKGYHIAEEGLTIEL